MKKCPKCSKQFDDTWKVCIDCRIELKEDLNLTQEEGEQLVKIIDSIDNAIADSTGDIKLVLAGGHDSIEETRKLCREIMDDISGEFKRGDIDIVHLYYVLQMAIMTLSNIDMAIMVEMQHSDNHKEGCKVIMDTIKIYRSMTVDTQENAIEGLSKSRSKKARSVAHKVGNCFEEFHKALYMTENSIKNTLQWEEKHKK